MAKPGEPGFENARYKRTELYSNAKAPAEPKHLFKVVGDRIASHAPAPAALLDVGGASGDLAAYLSSRFTSAAVSCLEYDPELAKIAQEKNPSLRCVQGDANAMDAFPASEFDAVTMVGVLPIFDDFRPSLRECVRVAKDGALLVIVNQMNELPIDALVRWRASGDEQGAWNLGWNLHSKQSISAFLETMQRVKSFTFEKFELPFDIPQQSDLIRTWTETREGKRIFRNGIFPEVNLQILTVRLK